VARAGVARRRPAIKPARQLAPRRRCWLGFRRRLPRFSGFAVRYNLAALRPATSPAHPLRCPAPNPSPALVSAVFPAAAPALAAVGGRAWSDVVAARPVRPAKKRGRFPSGRALVLRIKPGKPRRSCPFGLPSLTPSGQPANCRRMPLRAAACKAKPSLLPAVTPLAYAPLRLLGPQNPARQSSQGRKGRACYGRRACHAPCFPRIYITRNSVPWPFGRSLVPRSLPGCGFAHRIRVMQNRGSLRKARARPGGVVIRPASLLPAPASKPARH
jgi:hypothetical protein